ncbi:MAG TPA: hypothetical protein VI489_06040 [Candidatus Brocadiaceae bacterium]
MNKLLKVQSTVQPNGKTTKYSNGMERPQILPSNHPKVLKMRLDRAMNVMKPKRSLIEEAGVIIQLKSEKLRRAVK